MFIPLYCNYTRENIVLISTFSAKTRRKKREVLRKVFIPSFLFKSRGKFH